MMRPAGHTYLYIRKSHAFHWKPRFRNSMATKAFGRGIWWLWFFFGGSPK